MESRFDMEKSFGAHIPIAPGSDLNVCNEGEGRDKRIFPYRKLVGSLMYIAVTTRPDVKYTVSKLARFTNNAGERH